MASTWGKTLLVATLIAFAWLGFGGINQANAYSGYEGYGHTVYHVHTIYKVRHVTHNHYRVHVHYVQHYRRVVNVTRIRPIIYVHNVYHIRDRWIPVWHTKYVSVTKWLPAHVYSSTTVIHYHHHHYHAGY